FGTESEQPSLRHQQQHRAQTAQLRAHHLARVVVEGGSPRRGRVPAEDEHDRLAAELLQRHHPVRSGAQGRAGSTPAATTGWTHAILLLGRPSKRRVAGAGVKAALERSRAAALFRRRGAYPTFESAACDTTLWPATTTAPWRRTARSRRPPGR